MPLDRQLLEHLRIRGRSRLGALLDRQAHLIEEDFAKLHRRVDVQLTPGELVDFFLDQFQLDIQPPTHRGKEFDVDRHAGSFHIDQDGHQASRYRRRSSQAVVVELAHQPSRSATRGRRARPQGAGCRGVEPGKGNLGLALSAQVLVGGDLPPELLKTKVSRSC